MKVDLQLHEFCSVVVKLTIKNNKNIHSGDVILSTTKKGLGPKLESNGSETHQKSVGTVPRVNLPRLNNILSFNIASERHFFNAVLVTSL